MVPSQGHLNKGLSAVGNSPFSIYYPTLTTYGEWAITNSAKTFIKVTL